MTFKDFVQHWKDSLLLVFATIALVFTTFTFIKTNFYSLDSLQAVAIGEVDERLVPNRQDRIDLRLSVVNAGTREAAILQADIVTLKKEGNGFAWVRIWPSVGQGFEAKALKPGEITIVSLVTSGYAHDYFMDAQYSRPIDERHHEFVEGVRIKSMDSRGQIYSVVYPISQYKVLNDWKAGPPSEGYTFDRTPHELLVRTQPMIPPLAIKYADDVP